MNVRPLPQRARAWRRPASSWSLPARPPRTCAPPLLSAFAALLRARLLPAIALALVLATGQLALNAHLIGHAAAASSAQSVQTLQADADGGNSEPPGYCLECLALGHLDLPLGAALFSPAPAGADDAPPALAADRRAFLAPLPPRCRAPPIRA